MKRHSRSRSWVLAALASCGSVGACNQVLGIEAAQTDPRLSRSDAGSSAAMAGTEGAVAGTGGSSAGSVSTTGGNAGSLGNEPGAGAPAAYGGEGGDSSGPGSGGSSTGNAGNGHGHGAAPSGAGMGGDDGGGGEPSVEPVDYCQDYCDEIQEQCTGAVAQYRDHAQCMRICGMYPQGVVGGPDGNTVACRLKYAKKTRYANGVEFNAYCRQAGPSGDGTCGSNCEGFCTLMANVCTQESAGTFHFATTEECLTNCEALPVPSISYSSSDPAVSDGNHVLCRLFHVTSAAMADADEHCEHSMGVTLCEGSPE